MNLPYLPDERLAARPPETVTVSQHAERVLVLDKNSSVQGPFLLDMVPFWEFVMDACASSRWDEINAMKSAQIAGTTSLLVAVVAYYANQEPAALACVLADQDTAEYVMRQKIEQSFVDSNELRKIYDPKTFGKSEAVLKNGGYLKAVWASSVAGLGTRPFRVVICDEIDKPGYVKSTGEAGALSLAGERTNSFPEGFFKQIRLSTPTTDAGNIAVELEKCRAVFDYHVPCPFCGQRQPLRWSPEYAFGFGSGKFRDESGAIRQLGGVVWKGGRDATAKQARETARYRCGECGGLWTNGQKNTAVRQARSFPNSGWVARNEFDNYDRKMGVHVNRLYSLFDGGNLGKLVEKFCEIMRIPDGPEKVRELQGFVNSTLAEPFLLMGQERQGEEVYRLRDDRPAELVPSVPVVLTAGIDTQADGFWYTIRAFGLGVHLPSWQIRSGFVTSFEALEEVVLRAEYRDAGGKGHRVQLAVMDAMIGGERTRDVYDFCVRHRGTVFPFKGEQRMMAPWVLSDLEHYPKSKKIIQGGLKLLRADTTFFKNGLYSKMQIPPGDPGAWLFHSELTPEWAEMMASEYVDGRGVWQPRRGRQNHGWDCEVYAFIAAEVLRLKYRKQDVEPVRKPKPARGVEESNPYLGGGFTGNGNPYM